MKFCFLSQDVKLHLQIIMIPSLLLRLLGSLELFDCFCHSLVLYLNQLCGVLGAPFDFTGQSLNMNRPFFSKERNFI